MSRPSHSESVSSRMRSGRNAKMWSTLVFSFLSHKLIHDHASIIFIIANSRSRMGHGHGIGNQDHAMAVPPRAGPPAPGFYFTDFFSLSSERLTAKFRIQ